MAKFPSWRSIEPFAVPLCLMALGLIKLFDGPIVLTIAVLVVASVVCIWQMSHMDREEDLELSWRWPFIRPIQKESSPDSSSGPQ